MKRKLCMLLASVLCIGMLAGCGSEEKKEQGAQEEKKVIKLGSSPTTAVLMESAKPALEKMGYKVETKVFDDYVLPNTAVVEGSIDGNIFQHEDYLNQFNKNNNGDLVMVDKLVFTDTGLYSDKIKDLNSIPDGAEVGIFQDASNQSRALRILKAANLLKFKPEAGNGPYSLLDIEENPKNLQFKTMDINQLIKNIDQLDMAFIPSSQLGLYGKEPKYKLAEDKFDDENAKFATGLVVKKENKDTKWAKDIVKAFEEKDTQEKIKEAFKGHIQIVVGSGK